MLVTRRLGSTSLLGGSDRLQYEGASTTQDEKGN